jgi:hypothetical protein
MRQDQALAEDVLRRKGELARAVRLGEIAREFGGVTEERVRYRIGRMKLAFAGAA